jgi:hypothetical protein
MYPPGRGPTNRIPSQHEIPGNTVAGPTSPTGTEPPVRGLALLDSIFASAATSSPNIAHAIAQPSHVPRDGEMNAAFRFPQASAPPYSPARKPSYGLSPALQQAHIHSPKPVHTSLPDILSFTPESQTPSRASSVARSGGSGTDSSRSRRSTRRYEGDNEESDLSAAEHLSESSTVLDEDVADGAVTGLVPPVIGTEATPRPVLHNIASSTPPVSGGLMSVSSSASIATVRGAPPPLSRQDTLRPSAAQSVFAAREQQFEDSSELWPASGLVDDRSSEHESEVLELDFSDTRALSDPAAFATETTKSKNRRKKNRKGKDGVVAAESPAATGGSTTTNGAATNGRGRAKQAREAVAESPNQTNGTHGGAIHPDAARESILMTLFQHQPKPSALTPQIPRNDFVREVLTLVHVCS